MLRGPPCGAQVPGAAAEVDGEVGLRERRRKVAIAAVANAATLSDAITFFNNAIAVHTESGRFAQAAKVSCAAAVSFFAHPIPLLLHHLRFSTLPLLLLQAVLKS